MRTIAEMAAVNGGHRLDDTCASIQEAQHVFNLLVDRFRRAGWLLALYGSVMRNGHGRDVDFIAVNWRQRPMPPDMLISEFAAQSHFRMEKGALEGVESVKFRYGAAILDIQFRETKERDYCHEQRY